jgi:hypothetical protein
MFFVGVGAMPVLGARQYACYVARARFRCPAPAHLHPPVTLQEVEHLLTAVGVPEGPCASLEGHAPD